MSVCENVDHAYIHNNTLFTIRINWYYTNPGCSISLSFQLLHVCFAPVALSLHVPCLVSLGPLLTLAPKPAKHPLVSEQQDWQSLSLYLSLQQHWRDLSVITTSDLESISAAIAHCPDKSAKTDNSTTASVTLLPAVRFIMVSFALAKLSDAASASPLASRSSSLSKKSLKPGVPAHTHPVELWHCQAV